MSVHDSFMPKGWHLIKSVLIKEMVTASSFHVCNQIADALFHARLVGEGVVKVGCENLGQENRKGERRSAEGKPAELECDKCCDGFITIICPDCGEEEK